MGAVVFEGRHDKASNLIGASTVPVCFWTTTPESQNGFVGRLSARNLVIGLARPIERPGRAARPQNGLVCKKPCPEKALDGIPKLLRRKSGLCYTADANSPFEAYIYVS